MIAKSACALLLALVVVGCTPNAPYRTTPMVDCPMESREPNHDCDPTGFIEHHAAYDLAFVEFTERGNVFDRDSMRQVLDFVGDQAQ